MLCVIMYTILLGSVLCGVYVKVHIHYSVLYYQERKVATFAGSVQVCVCYFFDVEMIPSSCACRNEMKPLNGR